MYLIGIVGRVNQNKEGQDIIQVTDAVRRMLVEKSNVICITILPTDCNNMAKIKPGEDIVDKKLNFILDKCDAFVLPGGTDFYNFDEYVINYAIKKDKPLLAICLGFQTLCSMFAEKRTEHEMVTLIPNDSHCGKPESYQHDVTINEDSYLYGILEKKIISVDSTHHYAVNFAIKTLNINAISTDGIVEGVEYPNKKFIVGIQWHPEYLMDKNSKKLINCFVNKIK